MIESRRTQNIISKFKLSNLKPWTCLLTIASFSLNLLIMFLFKYNILPHHKSGFYCDDPSISFKFEGESITSNNLFIITLSVPFLSIFACEAIETYFREKMTLKVRFINAMINTWRWYLDYITIFFLCHLTLYAAKYSFGEPRPHFLDTCRPKEAINCTGRYIKDYTCTNTKYGQHFVMDAHLSFPSGHTALSFYAGLFQFWYFEKRASRWCPRLVYFTLQLLVLGFAIFCSISRITEHRHHWWDIAAGLGVGAASTLYAIARLNNFEDVECTVGDQPKEGFRLRKVTIVNGMNSTL